MRGPNRVCSRLFEGDRQVRRGAWVQRRGWSGRGGPHLHRRAGPLRSRHDRHPGEYQERRRELRSKSWNRRHSGHYIRPVGYDFSEGENLIAAGTVLASRQLMLAAAMNHATVPVRRKPIVAVLANGDELVQPGQSPGPGQIISSIPAGMKAAIVAWGGEPLLLDLARDSKESLAARVRDAGAADVILTIGGASVGEHDLVRGTLEDMGAQFDVLRAAMRPGKPVMFGLLGKQRILAVPGNPAAAIICARVFLKPLLDRFLGRAASDEPRTVRLAVPVDANGEREHYMRAKLSEDGVAPIRDQEARS